jgi:hypothetical protein
LARSRGRPPAGPRPPPPLARAGTPAATTSSENAREIARWELLRGDMMGASRWEETGINFLFFRLQLLPTLKLLYKIKISGPSYPPTVEAWSSNYN